MAKQILDLPDRFNKAEEIYSAVLTIMKSQDGPSEKEEKITQLPNFKGTGTNGYAFSFEDSSEKYVIKIPRLYDPDNSQYFEQEVNRLKQAQDLKGVVQFAYASAETGVIITKEIEGTALDRFTFENVPHYSDEQIRNICSTVISLYSKGFIIDPKRGNFILNEDTGEITILDFLDKYQSANIFSLFYNLPGALGNEQEKWDPSLGDEIQLQRALVRYQRMFIMAKRILDCLRINFPEVYEELKNQNMTGDNFFGQPYKFVKMPDSNYLDISEDETLQQTLVSLRNMGFVE